jgi:putative Mg2+ transporter-C (MgtC) family protein
MRTFGLVSIGACLYMVVGLFSGSTPGGAPGDQGRIAAQVVTGVGFLGGGMLIHSGASVHGLTTAAGIWVAAAVGLAAGEGLYYLAIVVTLLVLVVLRVERPPQQLCAAHVGQTRNSRTSLTISRSG